MRKRTTAGSTWKLKVGVIILLLSVCHLWGLDPQKTVERYMVNSWEMADGIPSSTVKSIVQTPDGYLWFGTSTGLVRYDGVKFLTEIYSQDIRSLGLDKKGTLWIGSDSCLTSYGYRTGEFKTFTKKMG
jgi:ligand-binding sensor domain-containing protein